LELRSVLVSSLGEVFVLDDPTVQCPMVFKGNTIPSCCL